MKKLLIVGILLSLSFCSVSIANDRLEHLSLEKQNSILKARLVTAIDLLTIERMKSMALILQVCELKNTANFTYGNYFDHFSALTMTTWPKGLTQFDGEKDPVDWDTHYLNILENLRELHFTNTK